MRTKEMLKNLEGLKKECERVIKNQNVTGKQIDWNSLNSVKNSPSWMLIQPCLRNIFNHHEDFYNFCGFEKQNPKRNKKPMTLLKNW